MTTIIYAVSAGTYDSYDIEALFSTDANAQLYIDKLGRHNELDNPQIKKYGLDEDVDKLLAGLLPWYVFMRRDGTVEDVYAAPPDFDAARRCVSDFGTIREPLILVRVECWARDKQHAIGIANEQRVMAIDAGEFDTQEREARRRHTLYPTEPG